MVKEVFAKSSIAGMELPNRILRSATYEGLSDREGRPTEKLSAMYERLAQGGVGAIITGMMAVHRNGRALCMHD
jgi:2,4-dienoyl-CoA reductase-like NADH-dependent reductase (Old Yellow Enzyme family)